MNKVFADLKLKTGVLLGLLGIMWAVQAMNVLAGGGLLYYGIIPREVVGLRGIVFAPFLHNGFDHLIANSLSFLALGWVVCMRGVNAFAFVTCMAMFIGGLGTWLIGATNSLHVGASGVVFGYLGYLVSRGFYERNFFSVLLSLAIGALYGGLIFGVLPGQPGISWEGHLFGLVGGILAAKFAAPRQARRRARFS